MTTKDFEERANFQGGYDRQFGEWKIIDIHEIPNPILPQHEIDFYCCNGKKVFLLRLRNRTVEKFEIIKGQAFDYPDYLIAELPLTIVDDSVIDSILKEFEKKILEE